MLRTVIIEDDPFHLELITDMLQAAFPEIDIVGTGRLSAEGVRLIRSLSPDLVFLDIDLPDKTGFEMLEELEDQVFDLVFVTAHEKYALEAHHFDSIGYLLKPFTREGLTRVLKKLDAKKSRHRMGPEFLGLIQEFRNSIDMPQKIAVPSLKEIQYFPVKEIIRLEADGNYTTLFIKGNIPVVSSRQIGEYETRLQGFGFFRVHDKHLVNLRFVSSFMKGDSGFAILEDHTQIPVARRRKEDFVKLLGRYFDN